MINFNMIADNFPGPLRVVTDARDDVLGVLTVLHFRERDLGVNSDMLPTISHLLLNISETRLDFLLILLHFGDRSPGGLQLTRKSFDFLIFKMLVGLVLVF